MRPHPWHTVPAALFARALALNALSHADIDAIATPQYRDGERRPAAHRYEIALLHTPLPAGAARAIMQQRVLDEARALAARNPVWGIEAYAQLLPALDVQTAAALRADAARLLDMVAPRAALRDAVRTLAPDRVNAWLTAACADLLDDTWGTSQATFRERVTRLHLLTADALARAGAAALAGIPHVVHDHVTTSAEIGLGGAPRYSSDEVRAAEREARGAALLMLAPWLPPPLHPPAQALAHDLGVRVTDRLSAALTHAHPDARYWRDWFQRDAAPAPAYTLAEQHMALRACAGDDRAAIVDALVRDVHRLLDGERLDNRRGRAPEALEAILATIAPFLDAAQTDALLARYGLPRPPGAD